MKKLFFILLAISATSTVFAQETAPNIHDIPAGSIIRDSSEHNRLDKVGFLGIGMGVIGNTIQATYMGSYFLNHNTLIEGMLGAGRIESTGSTWDLMGTRRSLQVNKVTTANISVKRFTGNSFYYKVGLEYALIDASNKDEMTPYRNYEYLGGRLAGTLIIGNQWQFDHFSIGCDWIGVSAPLTTWTSRERVDNSASARNELETQLDKYQKSVNVHLLHLYVGASF